MDALFANEVWRDILRQVFDYLGAGEFAALAVSCKNCSERAKELVPIKAKEFIKKVRRDEENGAFLEVHVLMSDRKTYHGPFSMRVHLLHPSYESNTYGLADVVGEYVDGALHGPFSANWVDGSRSSVKANFEHGKLNGPYISCFEGTTMFQATFYKNKVVNRVVDDWWRRLVPVVSKCWICSNQIFTTSRPHMCLRD